MYLYIHIHLDLAGLPFLHVWDLRCAGRLWAVQKPWERLCGGPKHCRATKGLLKMFDARAFSSLMACSLSQAQTSQRCQQLQRMVRVQVTGLITFLLLQASDPQSVMTCDVADLNVANRHRDGRVQMAHVPPNPQKEKPTRTTRHIRWRFERLEEHSMLNCHRLQSVIFIAAHTKSDGLLQNAGDY